VSSIRGTHRLLANDNLITDRLIWREAFNVAKLLIKRETNLRKLWATDTIFTSLPCFEMEEVPISTCCEYNSECTVSRSKNKIPLIGEGNYQYLIQGVWSINALGGKGKRLKEITINRYLNLLNLQIVKKEVYYWIVDQYLYTNNPLLKAVRLAAFFEEDISNDVLYPNCDCDTNKYSLEDICRNPLDLESHIPGYLEKQVLDLVSEKLMKTYFVTPQDLSTNNLDGQAPNSVERPNN